MTGHPGEDVTATEGERPTDGCLLRCEASWDRSTGEDGHFLYAPTWDNGRTVIGSCAYPYCDPTSQRMIAWQGANR